LMAFNHPYFCALTAFGLSTLKKRWKSIGKASFV
jgi:hypothetical protein